MACEGTVTDEVYAALSDAGCVELVVHSYLFNVESQIVTTSLTKNRNNFFFFTRTSRGTG